MNDEIKSQKITVEYEERHIIISYYSYQKNITCITIREWFKKNWKEVAQRFWDDKVENHKRISCDPADSLKKSGFYITKYLTKEEDKAPRDQGRFWGCTRNWGDLIKEYIRLSGQQLIHFRRLMKRYLKGSKRIQKLVTAPMNITVFAHWKAIMHLVDWVKEVH